MKLKRGLDLLLALFFLLVFAPLFAAIALCVRLLQGSPIFFLQLRPGLNGQPFRIIKFRTMAIARDSNGEVLPDSVRLTNIGRFLRATSLDELPELWNVLVGDMSLVGPRPLLMEYLPIYTETQARRHEVRPGITGWAQINGRNLLSWEERFEQDVWYVDNRSLWLDLRIMWLTIWKVLRREGISQQGEATMTKFTGSTR